MEWHLANDPNEDKADTQETSPRQETPTATFTCFLDGSWKLRREPTSGIGWVLELQDGTTDLIGIKGIRRTMFPLHTEMQVYFGLCLV